MDRRWVEIDWNAAEPSDTAVERSRSRLAFVETESAGPAVRRLQAEFEAVMTNGGALTASFDVRDADDAAHWMLTRNHFGSYEYVRLLLTSAAVASALPQVVPVDAESLRSSAEIWPGPGPAFDETPSLLLEGQLAHALVLGGAYGKFHGSAAAAKRLAADACAELVQDRFEEFRVDASGHAWSDWFVGNFIWDNTWVITDLRRHRSTILCITDTD